MTYKEAVNLQYPESPYELEFLLHYYSQAKDIDNLDSAGVQETKDKFIAMGLIEPAEKATAGCTNLGTLRGTEALDVYVAALLAVPLPIKKWVIPK